MINFLKYLYLSPRFFYTLTLLALLFLISHWMPNLYGIVWLLVLGLGVLLLIEISMLYSGKGLNGERILPEKFSNSDDNEVYIQLKNSYPFKISVVIIDELPVQFQKRDFFRKKEIPAKDKTTLHYLVQPEIGRAHV